ncbi:MAG: DUF6049 family protein, partial [Bifidobacteriaceae bacterium]|nr:DUF6049 family protein [Bifidobacteriaceae bacterium]
MRTRGTRAGRLAAAAMVAFGLVAGPAAADAKQARAAETALSAQAPTVTIIASTPVLTSPEAVLTVTARVSNETGRAWVGDVNLSVAAKAFADRAELAAWPEQSLDQWPGTTWVAKGLSRRLEAGQTETYEITSTAAAMALGGADGEPGWGPRGIEVGLETTRGTVAIARTFVVYAPPAEIGGGLNLSVVAG